MMKKTVLVRLPNWLGDVVASLPALEILLEAGYDVHCLGRSFSHHLLPSGIKKFTPVKKKWEEMKILRSLPSSRIIFLRSAFSSVFFARSFGHETVGYFGNNRRLWLSHGIPEPKGVSKAKFFALLVVEALHFWNESVDDLEKTFIPKHIINDMDTEKMKKLLQTFGLKEKTFLVCCPLSAGKKSNPEWKRWDGFEFISRQLKEKNMPHICCPGIGESEQCSLRLPEALILENLGLREYAAIMQLSAGVISNDSGPMHLAASVGVPIFGIFGDTDPEKYGAEGDHVKNFGTLGQWPSKDQVWSELESLC